MKLGKIGVFIVIFIFLVGLVMSPQTSFRAESQRAEPNAPITAMTLSPYTEKQLVDTIIPTANSVLYFSGTSNYGNLTNLYYKDSDAAYLVLEREGGDFNAQFEFIFKTAFYNLSSLQFNLVGRRSSGSTSLNLRIYNWTSKTYTNLATVITTSSYAWYNTTRTVQKGETLAIQEGIKVRVQLYQTINNGEWRLDYLEARLSGYKDNTPPNILKTWITPSMKWTNTTIAFTMSTRDAYSSIAKAELVLNGAIGMASNLTFTLPMTYTTGYNYSMNTKLMEGAWTVTFRSYDIYGNVNSTKRGFFVLGISAPPIPYIAPLVIMYPNATSLYTNEWVQLTIIVQNVSKPLSQVWLYDPLLAQNTTIALLGSTSTRTFTYTTTTATKSDLTFVAYVNDTTHYTTSFSFGQVHFIEYPPVTIYPPLLFMYPNATTVYVGQSINLSVWVQNDGATLHQVWLYDPILAANVTLAVVNANGTFTYFYTVTSLTSKDVKFIAYANDTLNNKATFTFGFVHFIAYPSASYSAPQLILYANATRLPIGSYANLTLLVQNGTSKLDLLWLYDSVKAQNISIAMIHANGLFEYHYLATSNSIGIKPFRSFVNDSIAIVVSAQITLEFYTPSFDPIIHITAINDTYLGINHGSKVSFSVSAVFGSLLDAVWIFNPIIGQNKTIATHLHTITSNHNYEMIAASTGSYTFTIYGNATLFTYTDSTSDSFFVTWTVLPIPPQFISLTINQTYLEIGQTANISWGVRSTEYALSYTWIRNGITNVNESYHFIGTSGQYFSEVLMSTMMPNTYQFILYANDSYGNIASLLTCITWYIPNYTLTFSINSVGGFAIEGASITIHGSKWGYSTILTTNEAGLVQVSLFNDTYVYTVVATGHITEGGSIDLIKDAIVQVEMAIPLGSYALIVHTIGTTWGSIAGITVTITNTTHTFIKLTGTDGTIGIVLTEGDYQIVARSDSIYAPVSTGVSLTADATKTLIMYRTFFALSTLRGVVNLIDILALVVAFITGYIWYAWRKKVKQSIGIAGAALTLATWGIGGYVFLIPIGIGLMAAMIPFIIGDEVFKIEATENIHLLLKRQNLEGTIFTVGLSIVVSIFLSDSALFTLGFGHILPNSLQPISIYIFGTIIGCAIFAAIITVADVIIRLKITTRGLEQTALYLFAIVSFGVVMTLIIFRFLNLAHLIDPLFIGLFFVFFTISVAWLTFDYIQRKIGYLLVEIGIAALGAIVPTLILFGLLVL